MASCSTYAPSLGLWRSPAARFLAAAAAWNALLFAVLRTSWLRQNVLLPFTHLQHAVASWYAAQAAGPVLVTLECSGTDVLAMSAGVVLAYPASWRRRALGVATILPALLLLNVVRIGTLASVVRWPAQFKFLHEYGWPLVSIVAAAGLVFWWMRPQRKQGFVSGRSLRVGLYSLGVFILATPWLATTPVVAWACRFIAGTAAFAMTAVGAPATATASVLHTTRGAFSVAPECVLSPIIPLWVAAVWWWPCSRRARALGLMLTLPVAAALATTRLLALAVPSVWMDSPILFVHGYHQLVVFVALVVSVAVVGCAKEHRGGRSLVRGFAVACACGLGGLVLGPSYTRLVVGVSAFLVRWAPHALVTALPPGDVQGALALLPAYQLALLAALVWAAGRHIVWRALAVAVLAQLVSQVLLLVALGELAAHTGIHPHALVVRAWAVLLPVALALLVLRAARSGRRSGGTTQGNPQYRGFWDDVGEAFPDLGGAKSTELYREGEKRLITRYLPDLAGKRVLKSDLWDEARNTRILQWMGLRGAEVFGIDISKATIQRARQEFGDSPLHAVGGDVRALPFRDASFDAVYSMGTIEHFAETDVAVRELFRVLKPGGRAIIGVPNRHDPFLRPLMVALLYRLGLYGYGFEKSYSRHALRTMLAKEGFSVVADDGLLFIPGWLRMLDLLCHTRFPRLARAMAPVVGAFLWLEHTVPFVRRHGYLLAAIVERPHPTTPDRRYSTDGREWLVDACGCRPEALRSQGDLQRLFAEIISELGLGTVGPAMWHTFDGEAGITGLQGLCESHLACHSYPEAGYAAFSLYCCRADVEEWPWQEGLSKALGATHVEIRVIRRGTAILGREGIARLPAF